MIFLVLFVLFTEANSRPHVHSKKKEDKHKEKNSYSCQICQSIAELTKNEIIEKTFKETKKFLNEKCPNITLLNKVCGFIKPDYLDIVSKRIGKQLNEKEFCKSIGYC